MSGYMVINRSMLKRDPAKLGAFDENGELIVHPAEFWRQFSRMEIVAFCVEHGLYLLPTTELVAWLQERIAGRHAIEIGSGNGVLAKALGIVATDNHMQEWPEIRAIYEQSQQPTIRYGSNVVRLDAHAAIREYKPEVVIGAWITHCYALMQHENGGNVHGPNETHIISKATYVFIGCQGTHANKPLLRLAHDRYVAPWLVSRSFAGDDFIAVWEK